MATISPDANSKPQSIIERFNVALGKYGPEYIGKGIQIFIFYFVRTTRGIFRAIMEAIRG